MMVDSGVDLELMNWWKFTSEPARGAALGAESPLAAAAAAAAAPPEELTSSMGAVEVDLAKSFSLLAVE